MGWRAACSMWFPIRSFCGKARRWKIFCIPIESWWARTVRRRARLLARIYAPLTSGVYYDQAGCDCGFLFDCSTAAAAEYVDQIGGDHQTCFECISCAEDLVHQCGVESVRGWRTQISSRWRRAWGWTSASAPRFLRPGIGYGGSCFPKDVAAFRSVAEQLGIDFGLLNEVERINVQQKKRFLSKVRAALWTLRGKRLGVLGLAFKGETDDIRESPAIALVEMLIGGRLLDRCVRSGGDGQGSSCTSSGTLRLSYADDAYSACKDVDAVLILTDWAEFGELDLERLRKCMRSPIIVDGRNMFDPAAMERLGFTYISVGQAGRRFRRALANWPLTAFA